MASAETETFDSSILSVQQMIDICLSPFHIDVNLLHALLSIIASKLNLQTVRVHLGAPGFLTEMNNLIAKSRETFERYKVVDGGAKKPFKLTLCKLEKIDVEPDPPVETLYKIGKASSDMKDFHRVTFYKESPIVYDRVARPEVSENVGYTNAELLNLAKRLEACEIGIERFAQLLQKMNSNYKGLERSLIEISTIDCLNKTAENGSLQASTAVEKRPKSDTTPLVKTAGRDLKFHSDQEARKDIKILQDNMSGVIVQINNLSSQMSAFRNMIQPLQNENESLKKMLAKSTDCEKLERCLREVCNMQKVIAEFSDKLSDLIICNNKTDQRLKDVNKQLGKALNLRSSFERIARLEDCTKNMQSEFENINERYEQIKVIKADREELDYLAHSKADKDTLNNLVTQDVFNAIRTDLSNGIVQAFEHIMDVELRWKCSDEKIDAKLNEKLDKSERMLLTKTVNEKLKCLQDKMNQLFRFRSDVKSSHTVKDAHCTYCAIDADIICREPVVPRTSLMRRSQKNYPLPLGPYKRYCGGSHTVLSPEQKIAQSRIKPIFMDPSRESADLVEGKNGMMYRVSKPECDDKKFPKCLYPTFIPEIALKNPEAKKNQPDASDVKS